MENWVPGLCVFTSEKGIPASIWAFIVSLLIVGIPVVKTSTCFFDRSRLDDVTNLYQSLISKDQIDLLVSYIKKYHLSDIGKYLKAYSDLPDKDVRDIIFGKRTARDKHHEDLLRSKRTLFAYRVYNFIIKDEQFVRLTASKYPELFASIFQGMTTDRAREKDLVQLYIECLYESKNMQFIRELKIMTEAQDSIVEREKFNDLPILCSLFANLELAVANEVWTPVNRGSRKSIKYESDQLEFLSRVYDSEIEDELWDCKVWIAHIYFKYMVREAIYREGKWHMWVFYYRSITELLIERVPAKNDYDMDSEYPSFIHYIIYEHFYSLIGFLELARELKVVRLVEQTCSCLGSCVYSLSIADNEKMPLRFKIDRISSIIKYYLDSKLLGDCTVCDEICMFLLKMFLNPKYANLGEVNVTETYVSLMRRTWFEFDKIPFSVHGDNSVIEEFERNVINKIVGHSD
jgi:hypothetical protein